MPSRYSQLYVERGHRSEDNPRARRRLWAELRPKTGTFQIALFRHLEKELGYEFPAGISIISGIQYFVTHSEDKDLLDAITIAFELLKDESDIAGRRWISFVRRVFSEENLSYRIDGRGVVHPFVDVEFEISRSAALEALNERRFGAARKEIEDAFRHLRVDEGKAAIRSMFASVETAAKVLFPGAMSRLMPGEVERHFVPRVRVKYKGNQPAIDAGVQLLQGMKQWIVSAQPYRHGQEIEQSAEPPQDFVIAFLSAAATYLRWLIELST